MGNWKIKIAVGTLLLTMVLTGCGAKNNTADGGNPPAGNEGGLQATGEAAPGGWQGANGMQPADLFAKVVKASGDSLIVLKSTMQPSEMQGRGGMRGGTGQGPVGDAGAAPSGEAPPDGQAPPEGNPPEGGKAADGTQTGDGADQGDNGGKGRGRPAGGGGMMQMEFAAEQTTLAINADTTVTTMTRGQDGASESQLQASDLKEGDIVMIWLNEDGKTALTIMKQQFGQEREAGNGQ
ncbi:hypothetical protein [Paenibacillus nasutitermitis]|uniref:DUF5666 domain-containing protein n=1 Tax=Paenibacillus nasutitermitis TaxID=1652958 RepID=A0A916YIS4_9BACL|nr:hypothetical protein [Paenibacillus nasutitermitis]GGD46656.1 hypothetical protein GCM10010911_00170 [Paenibacillus nasutitermitis]